MTKALLALHVIAAILAVGPVAVAASMFPAAAGRARSDPEQRSQPIRICDVYAVLGVAVPIFGIATATSLHVLGSPWLIASMALTTVAAFILAAVILPAQRRALAELALVGDEAADPRVITAGISHGRLAASAGIFNLLWAAVTVLMILRPGSTTGV